MATYNEAILQSTLYPQFIDPEIFTDEQSFYLNDTVLSNEYPYKNIRIHSIIKEALNSKRPKLNNSIPEIYKTLIESCWDDVLFNRPSFEQIVDFFDENIDQFITEKAEKQNFFEYVKYINNKNYTFNPLIEGDNHKIDDISLNLNVNSIDLTKFKKTN